MTQKQQLIEEGPPSASEIIKHMVKVKKV